MSIGICRIEKYNSAHDIAGIQIHDRRERDHSNSNPDIDFSRSHSNYSLCDNADGKNFNDYIDEQIKARYTGKKAIRKDAVRMFQVLCTSDKEFFDRSSDNGRGYFQACLRWAGERWGMKNIISAVVHLDEGVPHLHINIVPLTEDGRLSAKACVGDGSKALQQLQDDFFYECSSNFGLERGNRADLDAGDKPRKHQKMGEYKRNRATIQAQREIIQAMPENAPEGVPVPSMAKLLVGKENKDKLLYSADDIAATQQLAKAAAVTAAANEQERADFEIYRQEEEKRLNHKSAIKQLAEKQRESEIRRRESEVKERERGLTEREDACDRRDRQAQEREKDIQNREQELEERETDFQIQVQNLEELEREPDQFYGRIIDEKDEMITDLQRQIEELKKKLNDSIESGLKKDFELIRKKREIEALTEESSKLAEKQEQLQTSLTETEGKLKKEKIRADKNAKLYKAAIEVGEYRDDDFAHKVQLCLEDYRMSYIYGERGRER